MLHKPAYITSLSLWRPGFMTSLRPESNVTIIIFSSNVTHFEAKGP